MMTEPTLEFLGSQLERMQAEQREMRSSLRELAAAINNLVAGQTVFGNHLLQIERDMVQVKDILGHIVNRLTRIDDRLVIIETQTDKRGD